MALGGRLVEGGFVVGGSRDTIRITNTKMIKMKMNSFPHFGNSVGKRLVWIFVCVQRVSEDWP